MRPRYRHIVWDWNGTLLDDLDLCIEIINAMLRRRGLPLLDRDRYHQVFDFPVRTYYERVGFDFSRDSFEALGVEWMTAYDARRWECRLHPDAARILAAVPAAGLTQSVLSAYRQQTLIEIVNHFGLAERFERLLGLDDIYAHSKLELGRGWLRELGLPPREILLVGDTLHDWDVATELGVDCVLLAGGHHSADRLRQRTDRVFPDLAALAAWLEIPLAGFPLVHSAPTR